MTEPPFELVGTSYLKHRDVVQTPCGILYINGWSDWLSYRLDNRVFAYAQSTRNSGKWSLSEIRPDGTSIAWEGFSLKYVEMSASDEDLKLFNPPSVSLVSEPHELLLDIVEYTKNIID